eukprot:SAG31_NODE_14692_length_792_cov_1.367965_1_plen_106_part_10
MRPRRRGARLRVRQPWRSVLRATRFLHARLLLQILDVEQEEEEDGATTDVDAGRTGKCAVIKTSTRQVRMQLRRRNAGPMPCIFVGCTDVFTFLAQTIFLPVVGLV